MANKYFNKVVFYNKLTNDISEQRPQDALPEDIVRFDSKLEFATFKTLRSYIPESQIKLQSSILLKPKTQYSAAVRYVVDFCIYDSFGVPDFYVESKGVLTKESLLKLKILEVMVPQVRHHLIIVSGVSTHYFGKQFPPSTSLVELELFLDNKYGRQIR